jgi:hypothetical protein
MMNNANEERRDRTFDTYDVGASVEPFVDELDAIEANGYRCDDDDDFMMNTRTRSEAT